MSLWLPPFEYSEYLVDRRDPRPSNHSDLILDRVPRRRPRRLRRSFGL